ncbi:HYR domain-containing protein [Archangium violaceum]|uniref:ELWxxDGT repeat protein n=1 Tax=Archangium violaceum TaxID=83451 RepID=UPI00194DD8CF|nr:ELWxxDGT repeat protein [Archangium violaceum]QRN96657.1 HYR domain-containing protein [Archangium violaceum]
MKVKDIMPGDSSSEPSGFKNVGGTLFFAAYAQNLGRSGRELWKSDGTEAGTVLVRDIRPGTGSSLPSMPTRVGTTLFFLANDGTHGEELWKSDGTEAGTVLVKDLTPGGFGGSVKAMEAVGTSLFLVRSGESGLELWKSDGTESGTVLLGNFHPGTGSASTGSLTAVGTTLFFVADDGTHGAELWKSDGTIGGTVLVRDIRPGPDGAGLRDSRNVNGMLFFVADDGAHGAELWKSDGTVGGTVLVRDIRPGQPASAPVKLVASGDTLLFWADDGVHGSEPWKSDGTEAGTTLVRDVEARPASSVPGGLARVGQTVFFRARTETHGEELWKTDGTESGTALVKDICPGSGASIPRNLENVGGTLFFLASDCRSGSRLWKSDGTEAGTVPLLDIPGNIGPMRALNGVLYLVAGGYLCKSDVTREETILVKDISPGGPSDSTSTFLGELDGKLFFPVRRSTGAGFSLELWKTDGTTLGTTSVKTLGAALGTVTEGSTLNGLLVFPGPEGQLWKSDGTEAGTLLLKDLSPGMGVREMVKVGDRIFFSAKGTYFDAQLWVTDGTESGTVLLKAMSEISDLMELGGEAYFHVGSELWVSDGTVAGTVPVVKGGFAGQVILSMSRAGGRLLIATRSVGGSWQSSGHCWMSDGTAAGTFPVEGHSSSFGYDCGVRLGNQLLLSGWDPAQGQELWTVPLPDFIRCPGPYIVEATSAMGASVAFSPARVDEEREPRPSVQYSAAPGSIFPLGVTDVSATAGPGLSCTFPITVRDTTAPTVTCPAEQTVLAAQAQGVAVEYPAATVWDAVSTPEVSYSQPSGSTFPVGRTLVTVSARDAAGNTSSCEFHVQVTASGSSQQPSTSMSCGGCGSTGPGALAWQVLTLVALLGRGMGMGRRRG